MKKILILGSTGSIGRNALELVRNNLDEYQVIGISGNKNRDLLEEQIKEFKPLYVYIGDENTAFELKKIYKDINFFSDEKGLADLVKKCDFDIILTAISGSVGIDATIEAIKKEKVIALANKETMVSAGYIINKLLKLYPKAIIIPVDSEHSAIFQSMQGFRKEDIKKIIITASGGTFRGKNLDFLKNVKVEEALKHPNWSMGKKITIDSSTLVNKGLEVIEAHELFNIEYEKIDVIVHPQSIIHSMVEYLDGSIISQMGVPDMKTPILYALTFPKKQHNNSIDFMNFSKYSNLTFEKVDNSVFKGIDLAYKAGRIGGTMTTVFNAANEVAVDLFLNNKIKFLDIYEIIENSMNEHISIKFSDEVSLEVIEKELKIIKAVDKRIRKEVRDKWGK